MDTSKKRLLAALLLLAFSLFAGCAPAGQPASQPPQGQQAVQQEQLQALLMRQAQLYEKTFNGADLSSQTPLWMMGKYYLYEQGIPRDEEDAHLHMLAQVFTGQEYQEPDPFKKVLTLFPGQLQLECLQLQLQGQTAQLTVARWWDGVALTDALYTFEAAPAPEGAAGSVAGEFVLDGQVWHLTGMQALARQPVEAVIEIGTPAQLADWISQLRSHDPQASGGHVRLTADLDMSGIPLQPAGCLLPFEESCTYDDRSLMAQVPRGFNGTFEGGGHTISGVQITSGEPCVGFFGILGPQARVTGLSIQGEVVNTDPVQIQSATGGFAGVIEDGAQLEGCHFSGRVEGGADTGGFVGRVFGMGQAARLTGCSSDVQMVASWSGGGFVGDNQCALIEGCSAAGLLQIRPFPQAAALRYPESIGGFAGCISRSLANCHSAVRIEYEIPGANRMGSFIGSVYGDGSVAVQGCTIDPAALHEGWYLAGYLTYADTPLDITVSPAGQAG